jgi:REase_DpnII-MboI
MSINVASSVLSIQKCLREASNHFDAVVRLGEVSASDDEQLAAYYMERAIIELLVLAEHLQLPTTVRLVHSLLEEARAKGFTESKMGPEDPYLVWSERVRMFVDGVSSTHGLGESGDSEIKDLKQIIKRSVYAICDKNVFGSVPAKEADVHLRIEAILKCHFQDLLSKPSLAKPIKNFEPDTGLPSLKTLIEYKIVRTKHEAKIVVDQILADASGYRSAQWRTLLFVIYETHRVMPEEDWRALLRDCGLGVNYDAIVLSGDAPPN